MSFLLALLLSLGSAAEPPIVCNLKALTPAERARHTATGDRLKAAVTRIDEVDGGYRLTLSADFPVADLLQWVEAEQRCCPFLDFEVRLDRDNGGRSLQLTGRDGVKEFLRHEIPAVGVPLAVASVPAEPTVAAAVDFWVSRVEEQVVPAAEAMPESGYAFAPATGAFTGVRTFAEQVTHLAAANFQLGAAALGEAPPHGERSERAPASIRTKAEVVAYVKGSFAYLHRAATALDRHTMLVPVANPALHGNGPLGALIDALAHSSDHYGQLVEYLRLNGIVPPASR